MRLDKLLLMFGIDAEIGICGILIHDGHIRGALSGIHEPAIHLGSIQMRMEHQYQRLHVSPLSDALSATVTHMPL